MTSSAIVWLLALAQLVGYGVGTAAAQRRQEEVAPTRTDYPYRVEIIDTPEGLVPEVGGLSFLPNGRLVAVFHHGEVMIYDPERKEWSVFATGLHDPLGVVAVSEREMFVMQRPELTRLVDEDGDGDADIFETASDDFGMSGNYAEFAHGPVGDAEGGFYYSLNTASNNGPVRPLIRGEYSPRGRIGRMFSAVPYRGWVMRVTPDGETIPWASGFRSPNGLALDRDGNLFVTDNQGDWLGTSKLYHVQPFQWHGHPPSLAWEEDIHTIPLTIPVPVLDRIRVKEVVQFPHGILANSPSQPLFDYTGGRFGPFTGQIFVGEMNRPLVMRVMLEQVGAAFQGAVVPFYAGPPLKPGSNRIAFAPDGSLWVGHTDHGWTGGEGITRITWTGVTPFDIHTMSLTGDGFELTFTKPLDVAAASDIGRYAFSRYYYEYSINYGSDQMDRSTVPIEAVTVSEDGMKVRLRLRELRPGYVHQLDLTGIRAADGTPLINSTIYYTLNRLRRAPLAEN